LEGLLLGSFSFDKYKKKEDPVDSVIYLDPSEEILLQTCKTVCDAVNMAREWAHEPAAIINPQTLSERAQKFAKQFGLNCKILDDKQLTEMGAGAIVAVGQGSKTPSRMIILEYKGTEKEKPVVLVGKALTFDSGGYSIKPGDSMVGMKYDKCGAMAVLGVLRAASQLKIATPIIGIICAAENMLSQNSYRPDDILISLSGKSIEVISTDAEGRLVLADGLTYAQQNFSPQAIIDLATLTGGCAVAYGHVRAGVLTNNQSLYRELFESGERTWERIWQLPNDEDYAKLIKGKDADIKNSGGRLASPVTGGMFLKEFVSDEVPWAHLDIAGVADLDEGTDYSVPGATGFGVRLLIDWLSNRNQ
jgi:leucyl aminopeptidase